MTNDDEVGAGTRRELARARARRVRRHRLGTAGLTLFVGGPVLGFGVVVACIVVALSESSGWPLVILGGILVGLALHRIGLVMLLSAEETREHDVPAASDSPPPPSPT